MEIGKIGSLWRYPVKSILGEELPILFVDARGVSGDRMYAISTSEGKFGSGKDTRRFRRIDGLFSMESKTVGVEVLLKFPDGAELPPQSSWRSTVTPLAHQCRNPLAGFKQKISYL